MKTKNKSDQFEIEFDVTNAPTGDLPHPSELDERGKDIGALAVYTPAIDMTSNDFFIPRIRLAQGLTSEVQEGTAKTGDWLMMGIDPQKTLIVVPLSMARQQELRDKATGMTRCYSNDAIVGIGDPGGSCSSCPMNMWGPRDANGKGTPPQCSFRYVYMVYVYTEDESGNITPVGPGLFQAQRTSVQVGKVINSFAMMNKGWGKFALRFSSRRIEEGVKKYARPIVTAVKIKPELLAEAQGMLDVLGNNIKITTDDLMNEDEA